MLIDTFPMLMKYWKKKLLETMANTGIKNISKCPAIQAVKAFCSLLDHLIIQQNGIQKNKPKIGGPLQGFLTMYDKELKLF